jgi:hypothetical protein
MSYVVVLHRGRGLGMFGSYSAFAACVREHPRRYPAGAQVVQYPGQVVLAKVIHTMWLPLPGGDAMRIGMRAGFADMTLAGVA